MKELQGFPQDSAIICSCSAPKLQLVQIVNASLSHADYETTSAGHLCNVEHILCLT